MHVYEAIVRGLESAGVEAAFGGNGENIASLTLALKNSRQIRAIMTRHEQAASFLACRYAMYTNRLGVCFATVGPGAFNLISGLALSAEFEDAFARALAPNRPTVIDTKITRWALPHYSSSPKGVAHGVWELIEQRFGGGLPAG